MHKQQLLPDVISFSSAAHACGAHGYWEQALAICSSMRRLPCITVRRHAKEGQGSARHVNLRGPTQTDPTVKNLRPVLASAERGVVQLADQCLWCHWGMAAGFRFVRANASRDLAS